MDIYTEQLIITFVNYLSFLLQTDDNIDINPLFISNIKFLIDNYNDNTILAKIITNLPYDLLINKIHIDNLKSYLSNNAYTIKWLNDCINNCDNFDKYDCNGDYCITSTESILDNTIIINNSIVNNKLIPSLKDFPISDSPKANIYLLNINKNINYIPSDIEIPINSIDGDIIQVNDDRQTIFYINKQSNSNVNLIPTQGLYGSFLPPQAFNQIFKFGINYYNNANVEYIIIPKDYIVEYINNIPFLKTEKFYNPTASNDNIALTLNLTEKGKTKVKFDTTYIEFQDRYLVNVY